jgi:hypothetical protein
MQGDPTRAILEKLGQLPPDRLAKVDDFIDFLLSRATAPPRTAPHPALDFPVISVGRWPIDLSLHRKDLYGDDGR